jgi:dihydrofolate reductase
MGRLIVTEFMTLDGVAQAPGRPDEDRDGGFVHGGWQGPMFDPATGELLFAAASAMDALLLGRKTYEIFAGYWPTAPADIPFTGLLNRVPKHVASRTLAGKALGWEGASVLDGDVASAVAGLKAAHDEVHVIGSLDLLQSLLAAGLVDRLHLWVYPVVLGTGKRVFGDGVPPSRLTLLESVTHDPGVLQLTYEPAGPPTYEDMAAEG